MELSEAIKNVKGMVFGIAGAIGVTETIRLLEMLIMILRKNESHEQSN